MRRRDPKELLPTFRAWTTLARSRGGFFVGLLLESLMMVPVEVKYCHAELCDRGQCTYHMSVSLRLARCQVPRVCGARTRPTLCRSPDTLPATHACHALAKPLGPPTLAKDTFFPSLTLPLFLFANLLPVCAVRLRLLALLR